MLATARRVVTGHDGNGRSVIVADGAPPHVIRRATTVEFIELWSTVGSPALLIATEIEPTSTQLTVGPPPRGTRFRINVIPPGHYKRWPARADGKHPGMHRTRSIDYGIVLEGEVHLLLDDSETLLGPGNVVIQRGTQHAWENRSQRDVRMAFILIDAEFSAELHSLLPPMEATPSERSGPALGGS